MMTDAKRLLAMDVLDVYGPDVSGGDALDLHGEAAKHALVFSRAWHALLGCVPAGAMHDRYCGGRPPESGRLDGERFLRFLATEARMPVAAAAQRQLDTSKYYDTLGDPAVLRAEILTKLCDRYGGPPARYEHVPLAKAHADLRAGADMNEIDMRRNAVTGHALEDEGGAAPPPCRREAWRSVMGRDILFAAQAAASRCVFVESDAAHHAAHSAVAIASEAAASCGMPITLMSDCPKTLRTVSEALDCYHYAHHVPGADAYMAMPRLFQAFVLVGGTGHRPPLCRVRERCWHYLLDRDDTTAEEEKHYIAVADSFEACLAVQASTLRLAYLVPPVLPAAGAVAAKTRRIGFHPDTAPLITAVDAPEAVPPELAHTCEIYVSCVSERGVERCMAAGGVAVAKTCRLVDDGVNGFLSRSGTGADINAAVMRAVGCRWEDVGREAARVRLLHGEDVHRWLWRGLLARADPLTTGNPRDAEVLHERFLIISAALRYREVVRYRATSSQRRAVVFVDNRPDVGTALAVLVTLTNLRAGWSVVGFVTEESEAFFRGTLGHLGDDLVLLDMPGYRRKSYFIEQYNQRMKSVDTWLRVAEHADTCLTVQSDGLLVRPGLEQHPCMRHDYCGAPWNPNPYLQRLTCENLVGNGGFSLRSVGAMILVCRRHAGDAKRVYPLAPIMSEAEDVFFASRVANPCPASVAAEFAMEQRPSVDALGYHRFWMYHPVDFTVKYFERLLQHTATTVPSTRLPGTATPAPAAAPRPLRRRLGANIL
eukprot:jgi/Tetstr1/454124/TSEL_041043.t1